MSDFPTPLGAPLTVVDPPSSCSFSYRDAGAIAMDADGDFVVAWYEGDKNGSAIYAQRYSTEGVKQGTQIAVATNLTNRYSPGYLEGMIDVAMDDDGNFVVGWTGDYSQQISARRFDSNGTALGNTFTVADVSSACCASIYGLDIDMDADGDFVTTWGYGSYYGGQSTVAAKRFSSNGVAQGSNITVTTLSCAYSADDTKVAIDEDGNFVVVWQEYNNNIVAQRYNSNGVAQGGQVAVASVCCGYIGEVDVDMDADGDFVITWDQAQHSATTGSIFAKQYNSQGAPGQTTTVSTYSTSCCTWVNDVDVAMDREGDFVVTWNESSYYAGASSLFAQAFNSDGSTEGSKQTVSSTTGCCARIFSSAVAMDENGDFAVTYAEGDYHSMGIYVQRYDNAMEGVPASGGTPGDDLLEGTDEVDFLFGLGGNDELFGFDGDDFLSGQTGNDRIYCGEGNDKASGRSGRDFIFGEAGDDELMGHRGRDVINGGKGDDVLFGGWGRDRMTGGEGADQFYYNAMGQGSDRILDFDVTEDLIVVRGKSFSASLEKGVLSSDRFLVEGTPSTGDACFTYNQKSGALFFDRNGNDAGGWVRLAKFVGNPELTHENIVIV